MSATLAPAAAHQRSGELTRFIQQMRVQPLPPAVLMEAKRALVDWLGVSIGAHRAPVVKAVRQVALGWQAAGRAQIILGGQTTPALAALVNGTMAHAADFDDTHPAGAGHPSGPCWSTALALGQSLLATEQQVLRAFITGYEVMARLGGGDFHGVGRNLQRRGFHPTAIVGRAGAAAAASSLLALDESEAANALGAAATMMGGLMKSSGTHGKPFHAGKAAMDGIMAAELAKSGFIAAPHFYEPAGWLKSFIQSGETNVPPLDFDAGWAIASNGYKLYASCRATHASIETARGLFNQLNGRQIARIHARVHPMCLVNAGNPHPQTPLETKFSVQHCIALALSGYQLGDQDFTDEKTADPAASALLEKVSVEAIEGQAPHAAIIDIGFTNGEQLRGETKIVRGHPLNPLTLDELHEKFSRLTRPVIGERNSETLFDTALGFEQPGALNTLSGLLAGPR
ncbi:2-methylcitrate dehydratase [Izhakiella australiensis]|uniref:2-methylcitrate dehydratase n=1 Tax=Izhakiella australiensis TaxID=1926881 RepID=A0A1S8YG82_9GAMM|nr:MmgE/PrpD family protein [Izhakiella australiensis]OON38084.1 2-methylcitrate dehydratase [Izhakiella australiensis]